MNTVVSTLRKNRRTLSRHPSLSKYRARLKRATDERTWMATVRNISAEGIGLVVNRPFKPGMGLTIELPTDPKQIGKLVLVRVQHGRQLPGRKDWAIGGSFARKLTHEELAALRSRSPSILPDHERRTTVRHTTRLRSLCPVIRCTEEGPWYATIRNVSVMGIGLIASRPFRPGTLLTVELPDQRGELGKPKLLRVLHARSQPDNQWWVLGGEFLSRLTPTELEGVR
jgi:PilZ domain-containing protein